MLKLVFSACISANASRSYPRLPGQEGRFFKKRPIHLQLRVLPPQPRQLDPLCLTQSTIPGALTGLERVHPPPQGRLLDTEFAGHHGHGTTGVDHQPYGPSLNSGVNSRRCLPMMTILAYEGSTNRGQGQGGQVAWHGVVSAL